MNTRTALKQISPIKLKTVRINDFFENIDIYSTQREKIIKDYIYFPTKRIIA